MTDRDHASDLPVDSDVDDVLVPVGRNAAPLHLRPAAIGWVFLGGALGAAGRAGIGLVVPSVAGWPLATLLVNLLGAFALGMLLEFLVRSGPDHGPRRLARLLLGTGCAGAFTTYSALATETAELLVSGSMWTGVGYAVVTVVIGAVATVVGVGVGGRLAGVSGGGDSR